MNNQVIINADDYGLTNQISIEILELLQKTELNSTSVLVNGYSDDKHLKNLSDFKKDINIKLHLNLIESKSLLFQKNDHINFLTNKIGTMDNSFLNLSLKKTFFSKKKFTELKNTIKEEISLQIEKFKDHFNLDYLSIDSHQHVHNIPYIYQIIQDLRFKYKIKNFRLTNEKIFLSDFFKFDFSSINNKSLLKKLLFEYLNRVNHNSKILKSNYSFGLCENFNLNNKFLFKRLNKFSSKNFFFLEIFCHPGKALAYEFIDQKIKKKKLIKFYTSLERDKEKIFLKSSELSNFLLNISSLSGK
jgi:chitin disaccharide deacetylase